MNGKNIPVRFATGHSLDQAKAFFAASATSGGSTVLDASKSIQPEDAAWEVVAEWDASHSVPRRGDGQRINNPSLVEWSPNGEKLVTACDAFGMTRWYADGRRIGGGTSPYAYGDPTRFFWSPDGDFVLLEARTAQNNWWSVQDSEGNVIRQVVANGEYFHWGTDSMNPYGLHRTRCFTPWRPGTFQLLIAGYEGPRLDLIDALALPEPKTSSLPFPVTVAVGLVRHLSRSISKSSDDSDTLEAVPVINSVSFEPLGAQDRQIMRFAWHPSGKYVAVTTGHQEDKRMRRVHILGLEAGEIVASVPPTTTAVGWSPGGRLLFCQSWTNAYTSDWKVETVVWDSHTWVLRDLSEEERCEPWARHFEFTGLGVTNDALNANGMLSASRNQSGWGVPIRRHDGEGDEMILPVEGEVPYVAWSHTDPHCLATVGGTDASHSLRVWRLRNVKA